MFMCFSIHADFVEQQKIHNTFGERHVHFLEIGENEETPDRG